MMIARKQMACWRGARRLRSARAGVSLLEVMFSIGVVMIGLLGIAALLPVAGSLANRGLTADSAARLGTGAAREFKIRRMADPSTWRWFDEVGPPTGFRLVNATDLVQGFSFCIDPRFVGQGEIATDHPARNQFPFIADLLPPGTLLSMPRVTLALSPIVAGSLPMGKLQADEIFIGKDDLIFDLPGDRTLGPLQNFAQTPTTPATPLYRDVNGNLSWMATLGPRLDRMGAITDEYTLSIVVFSRRQIDDAAEVAVPDNQPANDTKEERVVAVRSFFSGQPAISGGDVELVTRPGRLADDLAELRSGQWVLLSGTKLTTSGSIQIHSWYRLVSVGEEPVEDTSINGWVRNVTLVGPDWDWGNMAGNTPSQYLVPTQVTIVRGVVAVYEKTIRLETSSLWTN